jgi:hypothetical protein
MFCRRSNPTWVVIVRGFYYPFKWVMKKYPFVRVRFRGFYYVGLNREFLTKLVCRKQLPVQTGNCSQGRSTDVIENFVYSLREIY